MKTIILPSLGEGVDEATVSAWYVHEGSAVKKDADVVEVVTDKATFNVPSPADCRIAKIVRREGQTVKTGEVLAEIE